MIPSTRFNKYSPTPIMTAPMVGLTHVAARELVRSYIPDGFNCLQFTEMLSARRLPTTNINLCPQIRSFDGEPNLVAQILVTNEHRFLEPAIEKLKKLSIHGLDINLGCPAKLTLKHNWGSRLSEDIEETTRLVDKLKPLSPWPLSAKIRAGVDNIDYDYLDKITSSLEQAGIEWITIHGRAKKMAHKGDANWDIIDEIQKRRTIPIIANGNIQTADDIVYLLKNKSIDGVMIGRAITARPWMIWQALNKLGIKTAPSDKEGLLPPSTKQEEGAEYLNALKKLILLLEKHYPSDEKNNLKRFLFFLKYGHKWFDFGHTFLHRCAKERSLKSLYEMIEDWSSKHQLLMTNKIYM